MLDKFLATVLVAIFLSTPAGLRVKLHKTKRDISVEVIHKPSSENRWIKLTGESQNEDSPHIYSSLIQSDGENCPIIHRVEWKNVPTGVFVVTVEIVNGEWRVLESELRQIIVGFGED